MKRFIIFFLIGMLLMGYTAVFADQSNEGEVILVDEWNSPEESDLSGLSDTQEPFIPANMNKAIFGSDDRITVYNPSVYPYSAIAYMEAEGKCGCNWTCTGFMVNKDRLLTAAHCLVCTKHSSWARAIDFYFGYKNYKNYLYHYGGQWRAWAGNVFNNRSYTSEGDFGCIKLYKDVGNTVGWFGTYWSWPEKDIKNKYLKVAGYRDGVLRYDSGWINEVKENTLTYRMDAVRGNSGGPIFDSESYVVGIHIAENDKNNIGYRLTDTVRFNLYELN